MRARATFLERPPGGTPRLSSDYPHGARGRALAVVRARARARSLVPRAARPHRGESGPTRKSREASGDGFGLAELGAAAGVSMVRWLSTRACSPTSSGPVIALPAPQTPSTTASLTPRV